MLLSDYRNVVVNHEVPIYRYQTINLSDRKEVYLTPFYNVYFLNKGTINQYQVVDNKKEYTIETIPVSSFNQNKSGIKSLVKYQNRYLGNNTNTSAIIERLPLSESGYIFEINSDTLELTIHYHTTDWYINEIIGKDYLQKALLYNSVSLFTLIDNLESIHYTFSGNEYKITRNQIQQYPHYKELISKQRQIEQEKFLENVDYQMNDSDFVQKYFDLLINK